MGGDIWFEGLTGRRGQRVTIDRELSWSGGRCRASTRGTGGPGAGERGLGGQCQRASSISVRAWSTQPCKHTSFYNTETHDGVCLCRGNKQRKRKKESINTSNCNFNANSASAALYSKTNRVTLKHQNDKEQTVINFGFALEHLLDKPDAVQHSI